MTSEFRKGYKLKQEGKFITVKGSCISDLENAFNENFGHIEVSSDKIFLFKHADVVNFAKSLSSWENPDDPNYKPVVYSVKFMGDGYEDEYSIIEKHDVDFSKNLLRSISDYLE